MQISNGLCEALGTMQPILIDNVRKEKYFTYFLSGASVSKTWKAKVKVAKTLRAGKLI